MPPSTSEAERAAARGVLAGYNRNPSYGNPAVKTLVDCYEANLANDQELIKPTLWAPTVVATLIRA
ncbi:Uu.00g140580.m01.CDS01 [Anthostomella pinea]|uniref:Uu.00g140580.m01.CDS01 n=1 Tax=Anthostomella pinea TaxID=933095 RepID=A0AAI8YLD1_9PEZI|nr:Uu.00g140580.m01.CDS01 [Anthostomella pinea]